MNATITSEMVAKDLIAEWGIAMKAGVVFSNHSRWGRICDKLHTLNYLIIEAVHDLNEMQEIRGDLHTMIDVAQHHSIECIRSDRMWSEE